MSQTEKEWEEKKFVNKFFKDILKVQDIKTYSKLHRDFESYLKQNCEKSTMIYYKDILDEMRINQKVEQRLQQMQMTSSSQMPQPFPIVITKKRLFGEGIIEEQTIEADTIINLREMITLLPKIKFEDEEKKEPLGG